MAGAALSQGQVQISWQAQHFREAKYRLRGRRSIFARAFARSSTDCVAGAVLWQGQVQISWQAQRFRESSAAFVAGAALSQGHVQISWQAQHFRKFRCR